ncbi:cysteine proteinase [Microstroma glucosiphilum]|uniref:ubiquitinyl hydrolase 1 n=1 Tax=Pseudomicrostroma glucosiphilum TaxID=1684307 RepID=A0A316U1B2_9BASI|nr:cysteine proteinase [Pseudomicrostroma glucosiphilum]PWN18644.1 cysteine proteinase [Pseudomicrostroma glucosiphilum]
MAPHRSDPLYGSGDAAYTNTSSSSSSSPFPSGSSSREEDEVVQQVTFSPDDSTELDAKPIDVFAPDFLPPMSNSWLSSVSGQASRATSPPQQVDNDYQDATQESMGDSFDPTLELREAAALVESGIIYDPGAALYDFSVSIDAPPAPPSTAASDSSSSVASTSTHTLDSQLRQLTLQDFTAAKPHPRALFCPSTMEWIFVAPAEEMLQDLNQLSAPGSLYLEEAPKFPIYTTRKANHLEGPFRVHVDPLTKRSFFSARIPSSIPPGLLHRIRDDRKSNPPPGKTGPEAVQDAFKVLTRILTNAARDDTRTLPLSSATIRQRLGYDDNVKTLFRNVGMYSVLLDNGNEAVRASEEDQDLTLRNLIEIVIWFQHYKPSSDATLDTDKLGFSALSERVMPSDFAAAYLGWSRALETDEYKSRGNLAHEYRPALAVLGVSEDANDDVLRLMYQANLQHQPNRLIELFSALDIVRQKQRPQSETIQMMYALEKSQGNRFTIEEVNEAYLCLFIDPDSGRSGQWSHAGIYEQYWNLIQKLEHASSEKYSKSREYQDALRTISRSRGDPPLLAETLSIPLPMGVFEACEVLGLPEGGKDVDDDGVLTSFQVHMMDDPSKQEQLQQALGIIAQDRKSDALMNYFQTGEKEEEGWGKPTLPAGLNNIGNTCYLNSVLQYFYALKPLRERVLQVSQTPGSEEPTMDSSRRVGGRVVTQHEVVRSQKLVQQLALLFDAMMTSPALAVSPERDLAYLALVSARAEELNEPPAGVVENAAEPSPLTGEQDLMTSPVEERNGTLFSGPRTDEERVHVEGKSDSMELSRSDSGVQAPVETDVQDDASMKDVEVHTQPPTGMLVDLRPEAADAPDAKHPTITQLDPATENSKDIPQLEESGQPATETSHSNQNEETLPAYEPPNHAPPPPLPPRPTATVPASDPVPNDTSRKNSLMSLGAQQDVSECLDNVLFQIEVALGQREGAPDCESATKEQGASEDEILRLFTGKTQQRVEQIRSEGEEVNGTESGSASAPALGARPLKERTQSTHVKNEIFTILPVEVREEGRDIYDSLDGFFEEETLTGSDGRAVKRTVTLLEPPPVLQIQLQRVQFDRVRGAYKSQAHLETGESIFMDRYLDFAPRNIEDADTAARLAQKREKAHAIRREAAECRARLATLGSQDLSAAELMKERAAHLKDTASISDDANKDINGEVNGDSEETKTQGSNGADAAADPSSVPTPAEGFSSGDYVDEEVLALLQSQSEALALESRTLTERLQSLKAESEALWETEKRVEYRLMSVFMHRGEASHGHYFINQRRVPLVLGAGEEEGKGWFKYNDGVVAEAHVDDVLKDQTGATPYLLCFVRTDVQDSSSTPVFETLKRLIDEPVM